MSEQACLRPAPVRMNKFTSRKFALRTRCIPLVRLGIILVYIHLDNPGLNEARVYQRVSNGGHNVPTDKIHSRIPRTMKNITTVLPLVNEARLFNNSSRNNPFQPVAIVKKGRCEWSIDPVPNWAEDILGDIPACIS